MALPALHPSVLDRDRVRIEFRVLSTTPKAYRIAAPFNGPDCAAPASTWVPRSLVDAAPAPGRGFNVYAVRLPAYLYKRVRLDLEGVTRG